ncbi:hypothetical protein LTR56_010124 [Elasticomyces elasticus]|nr:hypothetical protein LTR56_010124 [Elasticomyces elasticus]KAK3658884.1 hypothetical protein LTR22_008709 [Elasticomyces elasticus]KAK4923026.1 hypothetical protein LTR49_009688 [Elasticomyces elasticus]KAK5758079.1 hypothetical protein LTS12_011839 [Elasticomyces elasticus]
MSSQVDEMKRERAQKEAQRTRELATLTTKTIDKMAALEESSKKEQEELIGYMNAKLSELEASSKMVVDLGVAGMVEGNPRLKAKFEALEARFKQNK